MGADSAIGGIDKGGARQRTFIFFTFGRGERGLFVLTIILLRLALNSSSCCSVIAFSESYSSCVSSCDAKR